jgi:hypothetical protein
MLTKLSFILYLLQFHMIISINKPYISFGSSISTRIEINPTSQFIINHGLPECRNCKHFIPHETSNEYHKYNLGTCKLYGFKNIVSGKITYEYADHCRQSNKQCSIHGHNYEPLELVETD